ncbi:MAG: hypothetical protein KKB13_15590 [Chloroflexi bacterium]|nr:hypothetical protein [Chloroflexota bacterium]
MAGPPHPAAGRRPQGGTFTIIADPEREAQPAIAYNNRHANRYLVVWQQWAGTLWDIHGRQVQGPGGTWGNNITIAWYNKSRTAPAVGAIPTTPTSAKFLVVWEVLYVPPNDRDIYGQFWGNRVYLPLVLRNH